MFIRINLTSNILGHFFQFPHCGKYQQHIALLYKSRTVIFCVHHESSTYTHSVLEPAASEEGSVQFATRADVTARVQLILHA